MPATAITNPVSGETLVGTEPQLEQTTSNACWRERLNMFTGRALTDTALDNEQLYRAGLLATLGQSVSPGTVKGLALTLDPTGTVLTLTAGYGIMPTGEDVVLNATLKTPISTLTVVNGSTSQLSAWQTVPASPFAGVLLLQPVVAQVSGQQMDTSGLPLIVSGNLGASCAQDPSEYPFDDWQIADAVQLVFMPWPAGATNLPLPELAPQATLRNRLAYTIFEAESMLGPDDQLPWATAGVPVGLIAFDNTAAWAPLFVDCSSVVRAGGLPRSRFVLPAQPEMLEQWLPATSFAEGDYIIDPKGNVQIVQSEYGTTGLKAPGWGSSLGDTTDDGTLVWKQNGPSAWSAATEFAAGQFIFDPDGYQQTVTQAGITGAKPPVWNGVFLPTTDGTVVWINDGSGAQPIVQSAQAQAQVFQLSEQLSQMLAQGAPITNLSEIFPTLPPSGILPVSAVNFTNQSAPWLPPNWSVTAAPVKLEELEGVIETGMMLAPLPAETTAPADSADLEPVEILIPLPDAVYDPDILVIDTPPAVFQQEVDAATSARNLTLQQIATVQLEMNALFLAIGPNTPSNPNVVDTDAGLTAGEVAGRQTPPPYTPTAQETFGTALQSTWLASLPYTAGEYVIDGNGTIQVVQAAGTTGAQPPIWNTAVADTTTDAGVTWLNNGPWSWQPNTAYVEGQFVVDQDGFRQVVTAAGNSADSAPGWDDGAGKTTLDGIVWQAGGNELWHPDTLYNAGNLILDVAGNVQIVQTGGISGDSVPSPWNLTAGQTTADGGVVWQNLGHGSWQANSSFSAGQAIVDGNGEIQTVLVGGTSGAKPPAWQEGASATTNDASIAWSNAGSMQWQAGRQYPPGSIVLDSNGYLQTTVAGGTSADAANAAPNAAPGWSTTPGATTTDGNISWVFMACQSTDVQQLLAAAPQSASFTNAAGAAETLPLLNSTDTGLLQYGGNGLQALITSLNARISSINDLLDTSFLTAQTDIYRYRQNVLGATSAATLATSPILANIATGDTAAATSANLQGYLSTILPASTTTSTAGASTTTTTEPIAYQPVGTFVKADTNLFATAGATGLLRDEVVRKAVLATPASSPAATRIAGETSNIGKVTTGFENVTSIGKVATSVGKLATSFGATPIESTILKTVDFTSPAKILIPNQTVAATSADITGQSPLPGAQLNLRTLTIAQRLQQSPSQEALFYSISNRLNFLQSLQSLQTPAGDPYLVVDDLPILVDGAPTTSVPPGIGTTSYLYSAWRAGGATQATIQSAIQGPYTSNDVSEATLYSIGIRVLEQHVMFLRALEARVQQYSNFVAQCQTALSNMQGDIQQGQTYLAHLNNNLLQARQNFAFTTALLSDELTLVASVNAQRQQILATQVPLIAYTRARTLEATDTAPSRQLLPANIANPVPACLQQTVSVPPELREIIGQLREAPANWLPAAAAQVARLQRPVLLQKLALDVQSRAVMMTNAISLPSSSAGEPGPYAPAISNMYSANAAVFSSFQVQRASTQPASLASMSWSMQVANLQNNAALNDLISSDAAYTEVSNAVARLIQQVSSVATCLYTRVSAALPVDRLAWAEYLSGSGASVALQSLAILPSWNALDYTDRQQMQMLVDWLFQQIDNSNTQAMAFMSDVVRTAILLASDVPLDNIIPSNISQRVLPALGGLVTINLSSDRIASGMFVQLYSGGNLTARAVVTDLDATTVSATVTDVYSPNTYLNASDVAHVTAQTPEAVAMRSVFGQS